MAERWTVAFGRYLHTLRERRGFSLDAVSSLSQPFADTVSKSYLSRCERGLYRLAFSKVIALSRIYEVTADVLVERMELDMELDRIGAPATDGMSFAELTAAGREMAKRGARWHAYGLFREAIRLASSEPVEPAYRDANDQLANAEIRCSIAAKALGRTRYALHELLHVQSTDWLSSKYRPILLDRISTCYRSLHEYALATSYSEAAIEQAEAADSNDARGYAYSARAHLALVQSDPALAARYYKNAFQFFKQAGPRTECAITLNNLAQCYFNMGSYGASRRAALAAAKLCDSLDMRRSWALSQILLGELDELDGTLDVAMRRWKEAAQVARDLNDRQLRFKAEFVLFRRALNASELPVARAIHRRLRRLVPWVPRDTEEVEDFNRLVASAGNRLSWKPHKPDDQSIVTS